MICRLSHSDCLLDMLGASNGMSSALGPFKELQLSKLARCKANRSCTSSSTMYNTLQAVRCLYCIGFAVGTDTHLWPVACGHVVDSAKGLYHSADPFAVCTH